MKLLAYQPHQKIYYPAGGISIILLPVLCILWLQQHKAFVQYRAMDIVFWSPEWNNSLPAKLRSEFPPKRNYIVVNITGNDNDDQTSLGYAQFLFKRFREAKDTVKAIHFHFGTHAKYWTFIQALDICMVEKVPTYAPYGNDLYAMYTRSYFKPDPYVFRCGTGDESYYQQQLLAKKREREKEQTIFFDILKRDYWAPLLIFLGMSIFAFRHIRK